MTQSYMCTISFKLCLIYLCFTDPHIKVIGLPEDIRVAKDLIMAVLDTKVYLC